MSVAVDRTGKFAYVANSATSGNVSAYSIDATTGALTPLAGSPFAAGTLPRSVAVDRTDQFLYVANFGLPGFDPGGVSAYVINRITGALTPVAGSPFPAGSAPFSVAVGVRYGCDDERHFMVQEYVDYAVRDVTSGAAFQPICANFTQTAHSVFFSFADLNTSCPSQGGVPAFTWALVKRPLVISSTSGYGLDKWREVYGFPRIVNSSYRAPAINVACEGFPQSRHQFGDAADLRNESNTLAEWNAMVAAANMAHADFVEPSTCGCMLACTHADWRNHDPGDYAQ